jgi:hypothetical protein
MSLKDFFGNMGNGGSVECWDHERSWGFSVSWSETGRGFGEYSFFFDKRDGKFKIDNESDSRESIRRVMDRLLDEDPEDVRKIIRCIIDNGQLLDG